MTVPSLSIVVISYNMPRELPRTLYSLSPRYQREINADDYEVLVVDNGSQAPPQLDALRDLGLRGNVLQVARPTASPVEAINLGIRESQGSWVGVWIDGARLASPRLLATAVEGLRLARGAIVAARGRYLGHGPQSETMRRGYGQDAEDALLARLDWQRDGYRLFRESVFDESSTPTWFSTISESNSLFLSRENWETLGGYEPRFTSPGGGLVNLDTWQRALALPDSKPIVLLGEATFHQYHGGTMTNDPDQFGKWRKLQDEYASIRGTHWNWPQAQLLFWGTFHHQPDPSEFDAFRADQTPWAKRWRYFRRSIRSRLLRWFPPAG